MSRRIANWLPLLRRALVVVAVGSVAASADRVPDVLQGTWTFRVGSPTLHPLQRLRRQEPVKQMGREEQLLLMRDRVAHAEYWIIGDSSVSRNRSDGKRCWREVWTLESIRTDRGAFDARVAAVSYRLVSGERQADQPEAASRIVGKRVRCRMAGDDGMRASVRGSDLEFPGVFVRTYWPPNAGEKLNLRVDLELQILETDCQPATLDAMHVGSTGPHGEPLVKSATRLVGRDRAGPPPKELDAALLSRIRLTVRPEQKAKARNRLTTDNLALLLGQSAEDLGTVAAVAEQCGAKVSATADIKPDGYTTTVSLNWAAAVPDIRASGRGGGNRIASVSEYSLRTEVVLWDEESMVVELDPQGSRATRYLLIRADIHAPRGGNVSGGTAIHATTKTQLLRVRKGASAILDDIAAQELPIDAKGFGKAFAERQRQAANAAFALTAADLVRGPVLHTISLPHREVVASRHLRRGKQGGRAELRLSRPRTGGGYGTLTELRYTLGDMEANRRLYLGDGCVVIPLKSREKGWHQFLFLSTQQVNPAGLPLCPQLPVVPNPRAHAAE